MWRLQNGDGEGPRRWNPTPRSAFVATAEALPLVAPTTKELPIGTGRPIRTGTGTVLLPRPCSCPEAPRPNERTGPEAQRGQRSCPALVFPALPAESCLNHRARFIVPGPSLDSSCPVPVRPSVPFSVHPSPVRPSWFIYPLPIPLPSASLARLFIPREFRPRRSLPNPSLPRPSLPSSPLPSSSFPVHLSLASVPCPVHPCPFILSQSIPSRFIPA